MLEVWDIRQRARLGHFKVLLLLHVSLNFQFLLLDLLLILLFITLRLLFLRLLIFVVVGLIRAAWGVVFVFGLLVRVGYDVGFGVVPRDHLLEDFGLVGDLALHPWVVLDLLDGQPLLRIKSQNPLDQILEVESRVLHDLRTVLLMKFSELGRVR